jgi:hypothetical protein
MLQKASIFLMVLLLGAASLIGITNIYQPVNVETQPQKPQQPIVPPGQIQKQPPLLVQPKPPVQTLPGTQGPATQKQFESKSVSQNYLTGTWKGQDLLLRNQGIYYVRQLGNDIMWIGMSPDDGKTWTNAFVGKINGDIISGKWFAVPRGELGKPGPLTLGLGTLTLKLLHEGDKIIIQKTGSTGDVLGTSTWEKQ